MKTETTTLAERRQGHREPKVNLAEVNGRDLAKRELRREGVRALAIVGGTYTVALVVCILLTERGMPAGWRGAVLILAFAAFSPAYAASMLLLMRRRFEPGFQAFRWGCGSAAAAWLALDGGGPPTDADDAVARLVGREDDRAVAMRLVWLAAAGRTAEVRSALDAWMPADPANLSRRARVARTVALQEGLADTFEASWQAASRVPDPSERIAHQAAVLVDDAIQTAAAGGDPFPRLIEARDWLGARAAEFDTVEVRRAIRRDRLRFLAAALGCAVLTMLGGLAAWSGMLR